MGLQQTKERVRRPGTSKAEIEVLPNLDNSTTHKISIPPPLHQLNTANEFLIASYDFNASITTEDHSQISVEKGDQLLMFGYSADGDWVDVECLRTNERGWIPTNHTVFPSHVNDLMNSQLTPVSSVTFQQSSNSYHHGSQGSLAGVGLECEKWYHGAIQRSYAEYLLNSGITGSFLVRESESHRGQLTISLRYEGGIFHYRINRDESNMYYVTESSKFHSVCDLVHHHEKQADGLACTLLYSATKRDKSNLDMLVDPVVDFWEIDRTEIIMKHKLGSGQYGVVYEALWKPYNVLVAVKTLKENVTVRDEFLEEARLMKSLRHQNLVQLLGVCTRDPPYYIVTEFMCNGNLLDYLRHHRRSELTPLVLLHMATQITSGMAYLEQHNFIHRDLAARNCLVGKNHLVKVADFGLARCIERDLTYRAHEGAKFPIKWTAPEGLVYNIFSTKSDVWAFGVLLWEIATYGKTPYPGVELQDVCVLLERGTRMLCPEGCPDQIYQLMLQCWQWKAEQRPTFSNILKQLELMQTTISIEDQVALELALSNDKSARANVGSHTVSITNNVVASTASTTTANNSISESNERFLTTGPRPPLPPRPPPPRRSNSCEQLSDENVKLREKNNYRDSTVRESDHPDSFPEAASFTKCTKHLQTIPQTVTHTDNSAIDDYNADKDLSISSSSLGRKRTAPRPPRRTTPVKPFNFVTDDISYPDWITTDTDEFPPPPPTPHTTVIALHSTDSSPCASSVFRASHSGQNTLSNSSIMSSSAIFPSSTCPEPGKIIDCKLNISHKSSSPHFNHLKSSPPLNRHQHHNKKVQINDYPNQTAPKFPFTNLTTKKCKQLNVTSNATSMRGANDQQQSTDLSNNNTTMTSNNDAKINLITNELRNLSTSTCPILKNKRPTDSKQPLHRQQSLLHSESNFQEELRDRLKQHSKQQQKDISDQMSNSKVAPNFGLSSSTTTSSTLPASNNKSGCFTVSRLKPSLTFTPASMNFDFNGKKLTHVTEKCPRANAYPVKPNVNNFKTSQKGKLLSSMRGDNSEVTSSAITPNNKRLSWTGPMDSANLVTSQNRVPQSYLPTIFSTSSTALDNCTTSNNDCGPLQINKRTLQKQLNHILELLGTYSSDPKSATTVTTEQLIDMADQLEACKHNCSAFIEQASCPARAKFNFRDKFVPLQTISSALRMKNSDTKRQALVKDAKSVVNDLLEGLNKLSDISVESTVLSEHTVVCTGVQNSLSNAELTSTIVSS